MGNVTRYDYYENHKLRRIETPTNLTRSFAYHDRTGRTRCVASGTGCLGFSEGGSIFEYDLANNTYDVAWETPDTVEERLAETERTITLNDGGSPVSVTFLGQTVTYEWDDDRNLVRRSNASGTYTFAYDEYGNLIERTGPDGDTVRYGWRVIDTEDRYIALRMNRTGPDGRTTRYRYDANGNRIKTIRPDGAVSRTEYNEHGYPIAETDFTGATTRYTYDSHGFRTAIINPVGAATNFTYDAIGRKISRTGPLGGTYHFERNARGKIVKVTDPTGNSTRYNYVNGKLQSVTNPKGRTIQAGTSFGSLDNLTVDADVDTLTYETDEYRYVRRFDDRNRLQSVTLDYGPFTRRINYTYQDGRLVEVKAPGGTTSYSYDAAGRIVRVEGPNGTGVSYAYDAEGRRTKAMYDNGIVTNYTYNAAGWLTGLRAVNSNGTVLFEYSYAYDAAGNRIRRTNGDGEVTRYEYDALDRLVRVTYPSGKTVSYSYDAVGNRISRSVNGSRTAYEYSKEDELLQAGTTSYEHDANGNRIKRVEGGATTEYEYGSAGRLTAITRPDGDRISYTYLPGGQRISRSGPNGTTYFLFSFSKMVATFDGSGTLERRYVHGAQTDEQVSLIDGGRTYYYHRDAALNVRMLTASDGSVAN
ncbi:MAG: hypothetical protein ABEH66_02505 [Halobacteriales archaeon]